MPDGDVTRQGAFDSVALFSALGTASGEFQGMHAANAHKNSKYMLFYAMLFGGIAVFQAYLFMFSSLFPSNDASSIALKLAVVLSTMFVCRQFFIMYRGYTQIREMAMQWVGVAALTRGAVLACGDAEMAKEVIKGLVAEYSRPKAFGFVHEISEPPPSPVEAALRQILKGGSHGPHH